MLGIGAEGSEREGGRFGGYSNIPRPDLNGGHVGAFTLKDSSNCTVMMGT